MAVIFPVFLRNLHTVLHSGCTNYTQWNITAATTPAKSLQSFLTLFHPIDSSPPGSPVTGIIKARTLKWVAISFSQCMKVKSEGEFAQSCLTHSNPINCSPPGSSIHGIFQARVLEWGAIAFSLWNITH